MNKKVDSKYFTNQIFRKYSKLINLKLIESKKQTSINSFFVIAD